VEYKNDSTGQILTYHPEKGEYFYNNPKIDGFSDNDRTDTNQMRITSDQYLIGLMGNDGKNFQFSHKLLTYMARPNLNNGKPILAYTGFQYLRVLDGRLIKGLTNRVIIRVGENCRLAHFQINDKKLEKIRDLDKTIKNSVMINHLGNHIVSKNYTVDPDGKDIPIKNTLVKRGWESYFPKHHGNEQYLEPCMSFFSVDTLTNGTTMKQILILITAGLLNISIFSFADNSLGKWVQVNPYPTGNLMNCSFFVNPAYGWAGGRNGCIIHTEDSGNTWEVQQTPRNCWISSIFFIDENEGWAVGRRGILYTANGGREWVQRNIRNDSLVTGYKIFFQNRNIGWLSINSKLVYTEDAGKTWIDRSGWINNQKLNDIAFVNDSIGFICADNYLAGTSDNGKSWINADSAVISNFYPFKIQMIDAMTGYCLGRYGMVKTINGGKTWSNVLQVSSNSTFTTFYFSSHDTGFALFGYPMHIFRTNDGATTWENSPLPHVNTTIMSVSFPERKKGIGVAENGAVFRISGNGDSFREISRVTGYDLNCIDFGDSLHGYAGAGYVVSSDSALLYTIDGGNTWKKKHAPLNRIGMTLYFDSNTIVIAGRDSLQWQILRSTDYGRTWSFIGYFDETWSFGKIKNIPNVAFFLTGTTNELFMSNDAGQTWMKKNLPSNEFDSLTHLMRLFFINADSAWLLTNQGIFFTSNACSTWNKMPSSILSDHHMQDIYFCSAKVGWLVGYNDGGQIKNGYIYRTDDGGMTWREQNNITYFPDYYLTPDIWHSFTKIYADNNGKQAWVLNKDGGILHTTDAGEHWSQDTIPDSPGMLFTDLEYNKHTNTLWLTSNNFGIWKYEIPTNIAIKNPSPKIAIESAKGVICKNNGLLISPKFFSDAVSIEVYNISGRLIYSKYLLKFQQCKALFIPLNTLPSAHYLGRVHYHAGNKMTTSLFFNTNIIK
jgi:photosystem II stability/assembly factor-like uncharacterized protein